MTTPQRFQQCFLSTNSLLRSRLIKWPVGSFASFQSIRALFASEEDDRKITFEISNTEIAKLIGGENIAQQNSCR